MAQEGRKRFDSNDKVSKVVTCFDPPEGFDASTVPEWVMEVDWFRKDSDIGREVGVSRQRVNQVRQRIGLKPYEDMVKDFLKEHGKKMHTGQLSTSVGLSKRTVARYMREIGMEPIPVPQPTGRRPASWKYDWDAVDWSKPDAEIARELGGIVVAQVTQARKRQNRPASPTSQAARRRAQKEQRGTQGTRAN